MVKLARVKADVKWYSYLAFRGLCGLGEDGKVHDSREFHFDPCLTRLVQDVLQQCYMYVFVLLVVIVFKYEKKRLKINYDHP